MLLDESNEDYSPPTGAAEALAHAFCWTRHPVKEPEAKTVRIVIYGPNCPSCNKLTVEDTRPFTSTFKGQTKTANLHGWYCTNCNESIHTGADLQAFDMMIKDKASDKDTVVEC